MITSTKELLEELLYDIDSVYEYLDDDAYPNLPDHCRSTLKGIRSKVQDYNDNHNLDDNDQDNRKWRLPRWLTSRLENMDLNDDSVKSYAIRNLFNELYDNKLDDEQSDWLESHTIEVLSAIMTNSYTTDSRYAVQVPAVKDFYYRLGVDGLSLIHKKDNVELSDNCYFTTEQLDHYFHNMKNELVIIKEGEVK